jgi:hypothetical protein
MTPPESRTSTKHRPTIVPESIQNQFKIEHSWWRTDRQDNITTIVSVPDIVRPEMHMLCRVTHTS